jgi:hypothetical protein
MTLPYPALFITGFILFWNNKSLSPSCGFHASFLTPVKSVLLSPAGANQGSATSSVLAKRPAA